MASLSQNYSDKVKRIHNVTIQQTSKDLQIQNLGLFLIRSPLLKKCLLVSFPTLSNMLKFSVFIDLIRGKNFYVMRGEKKPLLIIQEQCRVSTHYSIS